MQKILTKKAIDNYFIGSRTWFRTLFIGAIIITTLVFSTIVFFNLQDIFQLKQNYMYYVNGFLKLFLIVFSLFQLVKIVNLIYTKQFLIFFFFAINLVFIVLHYIYLPYINRYQDIYIYALHYCYLFAMYSVFYLLILWGERKSNPLYLRANIFFSINYLITSMYFLLTYLFFKDYANAPSLSILLKSKLDQLYLTLIVGLVMSNFILAIVNFSYIKNIKNIWNTKYSNILLPISTLISISIWLFTYLFSFETSFYNMLDFGIVCSISVIIIAFLLFVRNELSSKNILSTIVSTSLIIIWCLPLIFSSTYYYQVNQLLLYGTSLTCSSIILPLYYFRQSRTKLIIRLIIRSVIWIIFTATLFFIFAYKYGFDRIAEEFNLAFLVYLVILFFLTFWLFFSLSPLMINTIKLNKGILRIKSKR